MPGSDLLAGTDSWNSAHRQAARPTLELAAGAASEGHSTSITNHADPGFKRNPPARCLRLVGYAAVKLR